MKKEDIENLVGEFTWCWGYDFFIETEIGNFHWKDPEWCGGNGTIAPYPGNYDNFVKMCNVPFGRDKGKHIIKDYCGEFEFISDKER